MNMLFSSNQSEAQITLAICITGTVQGVGFRPSVYRFAKEFKLTGFVQNNDLGVYIECTGKSLQIERFIASIRSKSPKMSVIKTLTVEQLKHPKFFDKFIIKESENFGHVTNSIGADAITCKACVDEIISTGRRKDYAFTNCTECGPRLSITKQVPYDRANTTMADFKFCDACKNEYEDITDRRFHAQPIACPNCGPSLSLLNAQGTLLATKDVISLACKALEEGQIIALKGLGGFQLAVNASNSEATARLRRLKHRGKKPFAIMCKSIENAEKVAYVTPADKALLESAAGPIVLLNRRGTSGLRNTLCNVLDNVAPSQRRVGIFLPTAPLHHLLFEYLQQDTYLIMTSGNRKGFPQAIDNNSAITELENIADLFLVHNRSIVQRIDDSVAHCVNSKPRLLRRARGYVPEAISIPPGFSGTLPCIAFGGDLKNTVCFLDDEKAVVTQHHGDLNNVKSNHEQEQSVDRYIKYLNFSPSVVVADEHPDYQSGKSAERFAKQFNLNIELVQHHHAHIASCLGENAYHRDAPPVIGICLDGLGYASSKHEVKHSLWGGELLLADYSSCKNIGGLKAQALLGGEQANLQPWRNTFAHLNAVKDWKILKEKFKHLSLIKSMSQKPIDTLIAMQQAGINAPLSSSTGRLFDSVAVACGAFGFETLSFEAEAAMALESLLPEIDCIFSYKAYEFDVKQINDRLEIDPGPMYLEMLDDLSSSFYTNHDENLLQTISVRFHFGLARIFAVTANRLALKHNTNTVALSGGVFSNKTLLELMTIELESFGLNVLSQHILPCNDGGISFGQTLVAASRYINKLKGDELCA